jgi:hypothetical protein
MKNQRRGEGKPPLGAQQPRLSKERLKDLMEEATVDAHDESEQASGFYTMMDNDLHLPFTTQILGVEVTVESIDMTDADDIVAVCSRNGSRQNISIVELPLPSPPPEGAEWIEAYRYWRQGSV